MKASVFINICLLLGLLNTATGQTGPASNGQDTLNIYKGTGRNQLMVPFPEAVSVENAVVEAQSGQPDMLQVIEAMHKKDYPFVILTVEEKGITGYVTVTLSLNGDGYEKTSKIVMNVINFKNPGIAFEIHDIVFWQENIPLTGTPVFKTIIQTSQGPYNQLNYSNIPLTVNQDCTNPGVCTGHDFFTSLYKGYLIPPSDGVYYFYISSSDKHALWLSPNEKFSDAKIIAARSNNHGNLGIETGGGRTKSGPQQLQAGKVYAFYATQWIIHSTTGGILWEGPGISTNYIQGKYTMPLYDVVKPSPPSNLLLNWRGSGQMMVNWNPSTDNDAVTGYNIYVNGIKVNSAPIEHTSYLIKDLPPSGKYSLAVTSFDRAGNESFISNILLAETYPADTIPPSPPDSLETVTATGLSVKVKWSGAFDNETKVIGYNIYLDGTFYNPTGMHFSDSLIFRGLRPESIYTVEIESVDAGMNISSKSRPFVISTVSFDPLGPSLGEKRATFKILASNTSWNEGIGLNGPYENGDMVNNQRIVQLVKDFKPGVIRWGAIPANSKSFAGSVGPGKPNTYGKMMHLANTLDAFFALTIGVQNGIDYRTEPKTFLYLLEYLAGDATTHWGKVRDSEGYTEPLLKNSKGVLLEFGNEVWGAAAHNAEIGSDYAKYAQWVREMSDVVKSSPYYDPEKITMVYSGRNPNPDNSYGLNSKVLTGDKGHADCLAVSGYLGGNMNYDPAIPSGKSEMDYYKNGIDMACRNLDGLVRTMREMINLTGTLKTFYLYESNMTTTSYNGRFGQGIVMLDYLVNSMNHGSIVPTIFHLTGGEWRITQPANNYKELPLYTLGKFFNQYCKGHIMASELVTNNTISNSQGQTIKYSPVGAYAFNKDEKYSFLLINRDFENPYTIRLELPPGIRINEEATVYTIWEDDYNSFRSKTDSTKIVLSDGLLLNVPKHAMVLVAAKGEDPEFIKSPHGYYDRRLPDSISVKYSYFSNGIINTNLGTEILIPEVWPKDAFSTAVGYKILANPTQSIVTAMTLNRLQIKTSGKCGDEGKISILFYAIDNPEVKDTVSVTITNQGTGCISAFSPEITSGWQPLFYPNPADDHIRFNPKLLPGTKVEIISHLGQTLCSHELSDNYEIPIHGFRKGIYLICLALPDGSFLQEKMQKQ